MGRLEESVLTVSIRTGKSMMAKGVLRAFGLDEKKIAAAEKSWLENKPEQKTKK